MTNINDIRRKKDKGPYDQSLEYTINLYDRLPYIRDVNLCNKENIKMHSGNIVKSYQCIITKPREISS